MTVSTQEKHKIWALRVGAQREWVTTEKSDCKTRLSDGSVCVAREGMEM
jgi:hypothetical protein